ncbi:MAG: Rieske (2Fe-2S) protein [Flavobacteriales bacterium]|nr:Rieske (2Fe-2S) protein [Flavobacteriales bacterium]
MHRRTFLHRSCLACAALSVPALLSSCTGLQPIVGTLEGDELVLPPDAFRTADGKPKRYVVASHPQLQRPIAVFADSAGGYRAVLMRCTHKGVELRITGDRLECSAHGSTFDNTGAVLEGPASDPLRTFPVQERAGAVHISLKA